MEEFCPGFLPGRWLNDKTSGRPIDHGYVEIPQKFTYVCFCIMKTHYY